MWEGEKEMVRSHNNNNNGESVEMTKMPLPRWSRGSRAMREGAKKRASLMLGNSFPAPGVLVYLIHIN